MEDQKIQEQFIALESQVKQNLTKEALIRYSNLKTVHPETAIKLVSIIAQYLMNGEIKEKITEQQLKTVLMQIQEKKGLRIIK